MKKKILSLALGLGLVVSLTACGGANKPVETSADNNATETTVSSEETMDEVSEFKVTMVTDTGGVNDQSFNQSAWEGLQNFAQKTGSDIGYLESTQETDYASNLDKMVDENSNLIWGIGYAMADSIRLAADTNPDVHFGIIDMSYPDTPDNVTGVMFRAEEPSFIVGYIAGLTTKTDKVGFVGGMKSDLIDQFEYGFRGGVAYAAQELNKNIDVDVQYAESFSDSAKGKAIATKMFKSDCDIVFHAAGGVGVGVIEAAKDEGKFAIGVDRDQAYLAPENVLTSALKKVGVAIELVSEKAINGEEIGGETFEFGLTDGTVGIPEENPNMDPAVYDKAMAVAELIKDGTIKVPLNAETLGN